jgi:hypothetical protein
MAEKLGQIAIIEAALEEEILAKVSPVNILFSIT